VDDDFKILIHTKKGDAQLSIPTFLDYLLYKSGRHREVWSHLSDEPPPHNYKIILSKIFNEIFPGGFISQDMANSLFEESLSPETNELFINLMLSFGYKPHEFLHMDPFELAFVMLMYEAKHRYLDNLEQSMNSNASH